MNLGITGTGTETHGPSAASYAGMQNAPNLPGLPSVVQMDPQTYIKRLLGENGGIADSGHGDFFGPLDGSGGHGGEGEKKSISSTLLKWGAGILAVAVLWKVMAGRRLTRAGQSVVGLGGRLKGFFNRRSSGSGKPSAGLPYRFP